MEKLKSAEDLKKFKRQPKFSEHRLITVPVADSDLLFDAETRPPYIFYIEGRAWFHILGFSFPGFWTGRISLVDATHAFQILEILSAQPAQKRFYLF
jgi:hypothetical protein